MIDAAPPDPSGYPAAPLPHGGRVAVPGTPCRELTRCAVLHRTVVTTTALIAVTGCHAERTEQPAGQHAGTEHADAGPVHVHALGVDPTDPDTSCATTPEGGLVRVDTGASLRPPAWGARGLDRGRRRRRQRILAAGAAGISTSADGGTTWQCSTATAAPGQPR